MDPHLLQELLEDVCAGRLAVADALPRIQARLSDAAGHFATLDHDRELRTGLPEVVYGAGKSASRIAAILRRLSEAGQEGIATRVDPPKAAEVQALLPGTAYHEIARVLHLPAGEWRELGRGEVAVVCAGTSDLPVAEEAAVVAHVLGNRVRRVADVGVSGIHRVLSRRQELRDARVLVVVAGMEGALASVVAGLTDRPVIGVPTSVGYGTAFHGVTALLGMLNSCAPGVAVVNIDNGFGAACLATMINRLP